LLKSIFSEKSLARDIIESAIAQGVYTEMYGVNDYYLQKDHVNEFTNKGSKYYKKNTYR